MSPEQQAQVERARANLADQPKLTADEVRLALRLMGRAKKKAKK